MAGPVTPNLSLPISVGGDLRHRRSFIDAMSLIDAWSATVGGGGGGGAASGITVSAIAGLTAANVQAALAEIVPKVNAPAANVVTVSAIAGLTAANVQAALAEILGVANAAKPATGVSVSAIAGLTATNAQAAFAEIVPKVNAPAASTVTVSAIAGLTATTVQAALAEILGQANAPGATEVGVTPIVGLVSNVGAPVDDAQEAFAKITERLMALESGVGNSLAKITNARVVRDPGDSLIMLQTFMALSSGHLSLQAQGATDTMWQVMPRFYHDIWYDPTDTRQSRFISGDNHGISGAHNRTRNPLGDPTPLAEDVYARRTEYTTTNLPTGPSLGIVLLEAMINDINSYGGNDPDNNATGIARLAEFKADFLDELNFNLNAGRAVIAATIGPRGYADPPTGNQWGNPAAGLHQFTTRQRWNAWLIPMVAQLRAAGKPIALANLENMVDAGAVGPYGQPFPLLLRDNVHCTGRGGDFRVYGYLEAFKQLVDTNLAPLTYPTDHGASNLIVNPTYLTGVGAAGTLGAGVSGTVPDEYHFERTSGGGTATIALEDVGGGGGNRVVITLTPEVGGTVDSVFRIYNKQRATVVQGDMYRTWVPIDASGIQDNMINFQIENLFNGSGLTINQVADPSCNFQSRRMLSGERGRMYVPLWSQASNGCLRTLIHPAIRSASHVGTIDRATFRVTFTVAFDSGVTTPTVIKLKPGAIMRNIAAVPLTY